jgi:hypothetical protein
MTEHRSLVAIVAGIVGIVVISVAVVILTGTRPAEFPPGSPQAALQAYLQDWEDGDLEAAYTAFSSQVRAQVSYPQYQRAADEFRMYGFPPNGPSRRVLFDRVRGEGDRMTVEVTVEELYGDGLSVNASRSSRSIRMVLQDGTWRIAQALVWLDPGHFPE